MTELVVFLVLLALGFFAGSYIERQHFQDLRDREYRTRQLPVLNLGAKMTIPDADAAGIFVGSVVISSDYFKTLIAGLLNIIGGRINVYETLLERGLREAVLRMKEAAIQWGATQVINVRIETASISGESANGIVSVEVIAYGTGVK